MAWPKCLSSDMFLVWEQLSSDKVMIYWWRQGLIFIHKLYGNKGNVRDHCESSERPSGDSQGFPNNPKNLYDSLWVETTHKKLFLATWSIQPWVRSWVATRTCWECVPSEVLPDLEGELKLSKATVPDSSVALLWLKLFFSNMQKLRIFVVSF